MTSTLPAFERDLIRRRGFAEFVRRAWPHVDLPRLEPLVWDWHMTEQCAHWEALYRGDITELVVNVPPGQSKTVISGILLPAWIWTEDPSYRFMCLSYGDLAFRAAKSSRSLILSPWYQARWGHRTRLVGGKSAPIGEYFTSEGGSRFSTGLGRTATGVHAHMVIVDDPVKAQDAFGGNAKLRARLLGATEQIASTLGSRGVGGKAAFKFGLVMQRLHEIDPSQVLIDRGAVHLMLPERFEPERRCVTPIGGDHRTIEGELLNPKRFDARAHQRRVRDIGKGAGYSSLAVQAQLQQRPSPPGGSIFKGPFRRFNPADVPLASAHSILSIDCAFKSGSNNDYVGAEVWGARNGEYYCYHSQMKHLGFSDTIEEILRLLTVWPVMTVIIEDAANGPAVIETLRDRLRLVHVEPVPANGGIEALAHAAGAYYDAGRVYHADVDWAAAKERNLLGYPSGVAHDDDTAATAQAIRYLAQHSTGLLEALEAWRGAGMVAEVPREARVTQRDMLELRPSREPRAKQRDMVELRPSRASLEPASAVYLWPHSVEEGAIELLERQLSEMTPPATLDAAGGTIKAGGWVLARTSSPRLVGMLALRAGYVARIGEVA